MYCRIVSEYWNSRNRTCRPTYIILKKPFVCFVTKCNFFLVNFSWCYRTDNCLSEYIARFERTSLNFLKVANLRVGYPPSVFDNVNFLFLSMLYYPKLNCHIVSEAVISYSIWYESVIKYRKTYCHIISEYWDSRKLTHRPITSYWINFRFVL